MSLKISDMVLIPQGVFLWEGESPNISLTQTDRPQYGIVLENKITNKYEDNLFKDHYPIAVGDRKCYIKEEDVFPCL